MKISPCLAIPVLFLLLALAGCAGQYQASPQALAARQAALARTDHLIVPGQRIGPIRLGMGMDEVEAVLGKEHDGGSPAQYGAGEEWDYVSLNLYIIFDSSSAPAVTGITTTAFVRQPTTMGEERLANDYPVNTVFQLATGVGIGSSSFDVKRIYGSNFNDPGSSGIMMSYEGSGLYFRVSNEEHKVISISVQSPH